jgi:hypothetical protein|tara:strand:+ start:859 stop:1074 length:216 start_codon:yes stop_codon:yes gene_type:complete
MENAVLSAITSLNYELVGGLLQNDDRITLDSAAKENPLIVFRWKIRECLNCNKGFDITQEGLFYECGVCLI